MVLTSRVPLDLRVVANDSDPMTDAPPATAPHDESIENHSLEPRDISAGRTTRSEFGDLQQNLTARRQVVER
jgi:hypothetical protein